MRLSRFVIAGLAGVLLGGSMFAASTGVALAAVSGQNLVNIGSSGYCLDANSNDYGKSGDPVQLWACNGHAEQEWTFTSSGQLENSGAPGMCLDANSQHFATDGDNLQLWSCNTHHEQLWHLSEDDQLQNTGNPGYCLDANSQHYPTSGDNLQLWGCNTHPEQLWVLGTSQEASAIDWAWNTMNNPPSGDYANLCLEFVQRAWQDGPGVNIQSYFPTVTFNNNTYPQDLWEKWNGGAAWNTNASNTSAPPAGALVFYTVNTKDHPISDSHITISMGNGYEISTADQVSSHIHIESIAQANASPAYSKYAGWWLP